MIVRSLTCCGYRVFSGRTISGRRGEGNEGGESVERGIRIGLGSLTLGCGNRHLLFRLGWADIYRGAKRTYC